MAYMNKFIVAVKHNGKILRDTDDVIYLPFGAEYGILLKNKNSVKAVVKVEIDGVDVVDGNGIIVPANESVELKGFMKGMNVTNRFKFIKKTAQIREYRGDRIDDGMIRVEFRFEKSFDYYVYKPPITEVSPWPNPGPWYWEHGHTYYNQTISSRDFSVGSKGFSTGGTLSDNTAFCCNVCDSTPEDDGITVKGSKTHQGFVYGHTNVLEEKASVIILRLRGHRTTGIKVIKPVTTKTKFTCFTCGKKSKSFAKFCSRCGTYLE